MMTKSLLLLTTCLFVPALASAQSSYPTASSGVSYLWGADAQTPLFRSNATGADVQASISANTVYNGFEEAFARASLSMGALKARSGGTAGQINASASASFGDTFSAIDPSTGLAHAWQPSESVTFTFSVTGSFQGSMPFDDMAAKDSHFFKFALMDFAAYRPGAQALSDRQSALINALYGAPGTSWSAERKAEVRAEINRLGAEHDALQIVFQPTWLGKQYTDWFDTSTLHYIDAHPDTATDVAVTFAPGGSFEWSLSLDVITRFQPQLPLAERPTLIADFSHSVGASFAGPTGTVTASASGLSPGTVAAAVPEPASVAFWLLGISLLMGAARRRNRVGA